MAGGTFPFTAMVDVIVWNRILENLNPNPIPMWSPIPPFVFRDESDTPMMVRMKEANDMAMRL